MSPTGTRPRHPLSFATALGLLVLIAGPGRAGDIEYNRDIRPILAENCFACHGPDSASRKADLRLDKREVAVAAKAIVPGDPDASELVERILADDAELVMPPPKAKKTLTAAQKDLLRRWVAAGAEYQAHWSFLPPKRPTPPAVQAEGWVRNPIDRFVLAKLEAEGLKPAPEADRRTLARRLSLDLTGLPPEPAEVDAFVADEAPDAYERFVDKLLNSPRWGEHRARYWLDAARYADTHGLHFDNYREMWSYRDAVIAAFNRNQPFDQFTVEQLAGDLLPDATLEQRVASGFNRCNITTNEGGTIPEENLVGYTRDRTEAVGQVWLGLTVGCAVCHDHKFDPLSQREFYELAAFFNNSTQGAMDGNIKDTPPIVVVPDAADRPRWDALKGELADARAGLDARRKAARPEFDSWLAGTSAETLAGQIPAEGLRLQARIAPHSDAALAPAALNPAGAALEAADAGDFDRDQAFSVGAWVRPAKAGAGGAVVARMDDRHDYRGWDILLESGKVAVHVVHKWADDALKVVTNADLPAGAWTHVLLTYDGTGKASGVKVYFNGQAQPLRVDVDKLKGTIKSAVPLKVGQRDTMHRLADAAVSDLRVYNRALPEADADLLAGTSRAVELVALPADGRIEGELNGVFAWWLRTLDAPTKELRSRLVALEGEEGAIKARGTVAHVMNERPEPASAFILYRGDYDKRRDKVSADTPDILPPLADDGPRNRLGFARWLLRPDHPLTARVTANRFWQEVFGAGIVRTAGDFGVSGELPSHPELLDWLAVEFRDGGWDVKAFFKLLVTSAAYRQAAAATPEALEKDPANRLLSRGPRFRLDGEAIRDYALAASGLLNGKVGGPSVRPYQPDGVWEAVAMPESNTRVYRSDSGSALYRRSLYTFWKRAAPPASMDIFNAPSRETCTVRRERTNTPLQALVTLNDPQFVEAARAAASRTLAEGGAAPEDRLAYLTRRLLARTFRPEESAVALASLGSLLSYYEAHPDAAAKLLSVGESRSECACDCEAAELAAWTMLANELLNLDEVLNK